MHDYAKKRKKGYAVVSDIRKRQEELELRILSRFAACSANTRGRRQAIEPCSLRTEFQRDRDRILHCKSFRRLKHKTQVFIAPEGDHYRTRLTHTLEVAQIARTIVRALRLNEDLAEAIALGHDLGHTPFGHVGEDLLNTINGCGFAHNEQSLRIVDELENGTGLNLTWEVRDGILNHRTSCSPGTLEGCAVRIADKIAYINHDIDDAQRAGLLREDELPPVSLMRLGRGHGVRINAMILDVVEHSLDKPFVRMSPGGREATDALRGYLFEHLYLQARARSQEQKAEHVLEKLFEYYTENLHRLPDEYRAVAQRESAGRAVSDYIAGMSDQYAIQTYVGLFVPKSLL
ncbi:MAG: deoxyguanosinetriphosphate triphosphohydrolase [Bacillota bacterium]